MRVALYTRVSTEEQARNGLSLGDQLNTLRDYAMAHGHIIAGEYQDAGISARKPYNKRPALLRLLDDCRSKKIDLILFTKLDRWFRNVGNYYSVQDVLDSCGVSWKSILEDYETVTASGRLKVNIMLSVAQDEADRTSERIKFTFEEKRARGESTNGRAPLGYKIVNGKPVINQEEAEAARGVFSTYIRTRSVVESVKALRREYGISRSYIVVSRYLKNPIYKGEFLGNSAPAIVSKDEWDLAQSIASTRAQRGARTHIYLFSGILVCGQCGRVMSADTQHIHNRDYVYYRCPDRMRGGTCTAEKRVNERTLEAWLLNNLVSLAEQKNFTIKPEEQKRKENSEKANRVRKKMDKLKDLYLSDLIDKEAYSNDYLSLKEELIVLESEPAEEKLIDIQGLKTNLELYNSLTKKGKKEFWTRIIKKIRTIDGDFFVTLF